MNRGSEAFSERRYLRRLVLTLFVVAGAAVVWRLFDVLILAFAAVLLALVLRSLGSALARRSPLPEVAAIAVVMLVLVLSLAGTGWLFGSQISAQFDLLAEDLPAALRQLVLDMRSQTWSAWIVEHAQDVDLAPVMGKALAGVGTVFTATVRALTYVALLLFAALYLAFQPARYRDGLLGLIPPERRERVAEISGLAGETLRRWAAGQSLTMLIVGVLTGGGLWVLGIGAPLALGLIAGAFAFVPYVGPMLAAAPGLLMAATQGPLATFYAFLVYIGVHFVEGNLVTPLVQAEVVRLPPVLTVFAALVFGLLLGPIGVLLAAPLTIVLLVAVNCFYLEDGLGEQRIWPAAESHRKSRL
ncbi:MAG TPA: AI-2E family transporter [Stellaceae bacterium]|nr:AI-2E family transporter [Stellaceae bacterium]